MLIQNNIGFNLLKYAPYIVYSAVLLGFLLYVAWKVGNRRNRDELSYAPAPSAEPFDYASDDFICIRKSDGSTIASSGGVIVTGKRKD